MAADTIQPLIIGATGKSAGKSGGAGGIKGDLTLFPISKLLI